MTHHVLPGTAVALCAARVDPGCHADEPTCPTCRDLLARACDAIIGALHDFDPTLEDAPLRVQAQAVIVRAAILRAQRLRTPPKG